MNRRELLKLLGLVGAGVGVGVVAPTVAKAEPEVVQEPSAEGDDPLAAAPPGTEPSQSDPSVLLTFGGQPIAELTRDIVVNVEQERIPALEPGSHEKQFYPGPMNVTISGSGNVLGGSVAPDGLCGFEVCGLGDARITGQAIVGLWSVSILHRWVTARLHATHLAWAGQPPEITEVPA